MNTKKVRVSLFHNHAEVWSGTLGILCRETKLDAVQVIASIDASKDGLLLTVAQCATLSPERWSVAGSIRPEDPLWLKRAHYYTHDKTGNTYTDGKRVRSGFHWDREGPIVATFLQTSQRQPLVMIGTGFGIDAEYTPEQLRAFAGTLLRIADDAEKHPMGPRSFYRTMRAYDT